MQAAAESKQIADSSIVRVLSWVRAFRDAPRFRARGWSRGGWIRSESLPFGFM